MREYIDETGIALQFNLSQLDAGVIATFTDRKQTVTEDGIEYYWFPALVKGNQLFQEANDRVCGPVRHGQRDGFYASSDISHPAVYISYQTAVLNVQIPRFRRLCLVVCSWLDLSWGGLHVVCFYLDVS